MEVWNIQMLAKEILREQLKCTRYRQRSNYKYIFLPFYS